MGVNDKAKLLDEGWGLTGLDFESDASVKGLIGSLEWLWSVVNALSK